MLIGDQCRTTVFFSCPHCEATYQATQERRPEYAPGHFDCLRCNGIVGGLFDFLD